MANVKAKIEIIPSSDNNDYSVSRILSPTSTTHASYLNISSSVLFLRDSIKLIILQYIGITCIIKSIL